MNFHHSLVVLVALLPQSSGDGQQTAAQFPQGDPIQEIRHHQEEVDVGALGAEISYVTEFSGVLHVWVASEVIDPTLEVEIGGGREPFIAEDTGGGSSAHLYIRVPPDVSMVLRVLSADGREGPAELHWVATPETEETSALAKEGTEELKQIEQMAKEGELEIARGWLTELMDRVEACEGAASSHALAKLGDQLGWSGLALGLFREQSAGWEMSHRFQEQTLPPTHPNLLRIKSCLVASRSQAGDFRGAMEAAEFVYRVQSKLLPEGHPELIFAMSSLAPTRQMAADYSGALDLYQKVYEAQRESLSPEDSVLLATMTNLASLYIYMGNYAPAVDLMEEVLAKRERTLPPTHRDLGATKIMLGQALEQSGFLARRTELIESAVEIYEGVYSESNPFLMEARVFLSSLLQETGDLQGALELIENTCTTMSHSMQPDNPRLVGARMSMANTRGALGDLQGALEIETDLVMTLERSSSVDPYLLRRVRQNLAGTRFLLNDFDGALELARESLEETKRLYPGSEIELIAPMANMSMILCSVGQLEEAQHFAESVFDSLARNRDRDDLELIHAKATLASVLSRSAVSERVIQLRQEVLAAQKRLLPAGNPIILGSLQVLADDLRRRGEYQRSRQLFVESLMGQSQLAALYALEAPRVSRSMAANELRSINMALGLLRTQPADSDTNHSLDQNVFEAIEALKSVSSESSQLARACLGNPELESLRRGVAAARVRAANALLTRSEEDGDLDTLRSDLVQLAEERDRLQRELRRKLEQDGLGYELPTAERLALGLESTSGYISFHNNSASDPAQSALMAFVVTPQGEVVAVELGASDELAELVSRWRKLLGKPLVASQGTRGVSLGESVGNTVRSKEESLDEVGRSLRRILIDPCLALLGPELPESLHIALDDFLFTLPIDALPWRDGRPFGDVIKIHMELSSMRLMSPTPSAPYSGGLLGFGGIDYDAGGIEAVETQLLGEAPLIAMKERSANGMQFPLLTNTSAEVESVAQAYTLRSESAPSIFVGALATKQAFVANAGKARFVHIATHGWFASDQTKSMLDSGDQPLRFDGPTAMSGTAGAVVGFLPGALCGIAFAGANHGTNDAGRVPGILTAEELSSVDLRNCELAVLSACETNCGIRRSGQGIQSLQSSLHIAGAQTAITSLWKVDDEATRKLMVLFYENLWGKGLGKAEALWGAKMQLRTDGHGPRDWAAWVLTGTP